MFRSILLAAVVALSSLAHAEGPAVMGLHLGSKHLTASDAPGSRGWNETNPGVYARWANGVTVGAYQNSLFRTSVYAGWTWETGQRHGLSAAVTVGAVSGYDVMTADSRTGASLTGLRVETRCDAIGCRPVGLRSVITPLIVPSIAYQVTPSAALRMGLLLAQRQASAVHLMAEWRF